MTQQPQPPAGWFLDPAREEQVREWAAKLGASTNMDSVGPYSALCDALAEIDRLRAELQQAQQQLRLIDDEIEEFEAAAQSDPNTPASVLLMIQILRRIRPAAVSGA